MRTVVNDWSDHTPFCDKYTLLGFQSDEPELPTNYGGNYYADLSSGHDCASQRVLCGKRAPGDYYFVVEFGTLHDGDGQLALFRSVIE